MLTINVDVYVVVILAVTYSILLFQSFIVYVRIAAIK